MPCTENHSAKERYGCAPGSFQLHSRPYPEHDIFQPSPLPVSVASLGEKNEFLFFVWEPFFFFNLERLKTGVVSTLSDLKKVSAWDVFIKCYEHAQDPGWPGQGGGTALQRLLGRFFGVSAWWYFFFFSFKIILQVFVRKLNSCY